MYYKKLKKSAWPVMPKHMHDELLILSRSSKNVRPIDRRGRNSYHHYLLPNSIEQWCRSNLPIDDRYVCRLQRFFNLDHIPKHIDQSRTETFNYILTEAIPATKWYINNKIVKSVVLPQHRWCYLNVSIMHSVVKIDQERIAVCIFIPSIPDYV